ncbi:MAG: ribbon-helix-helix domain-containing protein [Pyrobaculum sp.]|jgi:Arc/MetJ-type ribon-helix-helix transcriptional regulator
MPRRRSKVPLERVAIRLPTEVMLRIDKLVEKGLFKSRSHLIKQALRELLSDPGYQEALKERDDDFPTLRGR